jgi:hypothetical protein
MTEKTADQEEIQVNVKLSGEDAARFRRYKENQKLKPTAAAAYKLIFERLEQVEADAPRAA